MNVQIIIVINLSKREILTNCLYVDFLHFYALKYSQMLNVTYQIIVLSRTMMNWNYN